jgi:hypothetical protein
VSYLVNELDKYFHEAQDLSYEFHFNWLIVLIAYVTGKISEGATFLYIKPSDLLATRFSTLWYTNDMTNKWQANAVFQAYYHQLKVSIESFPCMTPCTLHQYRPIEKFHADPYFIYITARRDENKEELLRANR